MTASEIVASTRISSVWTALGGGKLRHNRGRAFWRGGDSDNVALDDAKGCWHDFASNEGGGILDLIIRVLNCTRAEALGWVADFTGASLDSSTPQSRKAFADGVRIAADAVFFADAAIVLAEQELENLTDNDPHRRYWTRLITALRTAPESEYRDWWYCGQGEFAVALVRAGRERSKRLQGLLAEFLCSEMNNAAA